MKVSSTKSATSQICKPLAGIKNDTTLKRQNSILTIFLILTGQFLFSGCAMIGAFVIAKNATCKVKINDKCVKGSCDLINGVFFERLTVLQKDVDGMPTEYIVTERFQCYNPGMDGVQKYWPDKIYFNKINGHYKWAIDTVDIGFKTNQKGGREIVSMGKRVDNYNNFFILGSKKYDTCPTKLAIDTWYNVSIDDPRLAKTFLYIDKKNNYHVYKFDSGVCPI